MAWWGWLIMIIIIVGIVLLVAGLLRAAGRPRPTPPWIAQHRDGDTPASEIIDREDRY